MMMIMLIIIVMTTFMKMNDRRMIMGNLVISPITKSGRVSLSALAVLLPSLNFIATRETFFGANVFIRSVPFLISIHTI